MFEVKIISFERLGIVKASHVTGAERSCLLPQLCVRLHPLVCSLLNRYLSLKVLTASCMLAGHQATRERMKKVLREVGGRFQILICLPVLKNVRSKYTLLLAVSAAQFCGRIL